MKLLTSCILILFTLTLCVSAQNADRSVENIRKTYTNVAEKARLAENDDEQGQFGELVMNEIVINKRNHQWRAVGIYGQTFRFFYKGGDTEAHMYPDQLVMIKTERRVSSRTYREEFLYDGSGRLIFYFQQSENDETVPAERRLYFDLAKPIRIIEDGRSRDRLSGKDLAVVREVAAANARIKDIFIKSIKL